MANIRLGAITKQELFRLIKNNFKGISIPAFKAVIITYFWI